MYSNKELKLLLQSKKKRATALKNQSNKRVSTNKKMDKQIITENIKNTKVLNGGCCGGMVGRKRNRVMVKDNTQKIFSGVYDARNTKNSHTPINLRGGSYSLPVGDIISNAQHNGIIEAQNKYANAWRRRNQYVKF